MCFYLTDKKLEILGRWQSLVWCFPKPVLLFPGGYCTRILPCPRQIFTWELGAFDCSTHREQTAFLYLCWQRLPPVQVGINHKAQRGGFSKKFPLTPYLSPVCLCLLLGSRAGEGECRAPLLQGELGCSDANRNESSVTPVFSGLAFFQCKVSALCLRRGILILFLFLHLPVSDFIQYSLELA